MVKTYSKKQLVYMGLTSSIVCYETRRDGAQLLAGGNSIHITGADGVEQVITTEEQWDDLLKSLHLI